ncbi:DUF418 domain-containing protein [Altericroceibacterium xinjiangense]|uniref:DUF418 domain-containing protein n=1 Tax=Altericroceibacterium xinjiangense TaxID=762261 RepID=UPI000F7EABC3|nr:DUF418 domain-containing protein [Altericroceibacterium xinjiangense]
MTAPSRTGSAVEATPDQPVSGAERLVSLDFIRGIAVLGILFANITAYGHPLTAYFWPPALPQPLSMGDRAIWLFQFVVIDGKLRGLFTLLFGAGLYLFMERTWARGGDAWLQARRLSVLLVFGLAHYFLIWRGDILTLYAFCGLAVLPLLKMTAERQLSLGLTLAVVGALMNTAMMSGDYLAANGADAARRAQAAQVPALVLKVAERETRLYRDGSYPDIVAHAIEEEGDRLLQELIVVGITETFGVILVGIGLYRFGLFGSAARNPVLRRWAWGGWLGGMAVTLLIGLWPLREGFPLFTTSFAFNGLSSLPHIVTVLGLVVLLAGWAPTAAQGWLGQRLAAAGRMAFSNYLGTSILMMFVFHGWALGLFGQLGRIGLLGIVLAAWALMLGWSQPWLARFRYGPLEWVWRCLTYGERFPFRR